MYDSLTLLFILRGFRYLFIQIKSRFSEWHTRVVFWIIERYRHLVQNLTKQLGVVRLKIELTEDESSKIKKKRDLPRFARTESEFSG